MSNYNLKLNLAKLSGFGKITLTGKSGQAKRCVVLPIDENFIFEGEQGTYLDLACIENNNSQYGDTHFVTRNKTEKERATEKTTGERLRLPILGNLKPFGGQSAAEEEAYTYQPQGATQQPAPKAAAPADDDSDLPFSQAPAA